jgi:predicted membrane protein
MTIGLILKRMRREWRSLGILLLAVCLLTGFFALGPFYIRAVTEVGLRYELDRADPQNLQIALILDKEPISTEALGVVSDELGNLAVGYRYFIRADYTPPTTEGGLDNPGLATGGYEFRYGEPITSRSPRLRRTFQPFAFSDMPDLFTLTTGRWPVRRATPEMVDPTGLSDAQQQARQVGNYNRGEVEIVVTSTVAQKAGLEIGSRWIVGTRLQDGTGAVASVVVVGIVDPKDHDDPFWDGSRNFLEGGEVQLGIAETRYDFGFATIPEAYIDWLKDVTPGNNFVYQIKTNPDTINADNIESVKSRLSVLQNRLSAYHPGASVLSGLLGILDRYSGNVSDTQGPIILLSGAILIMMMYHLVNTVALVLEQQGTEWSSIVSRGGSIPQLIMLQFLTVGVLGLAGMIIGPLLSVVFMRVMEHFGPLSQALGGRSLGSTHIPNISIILSTTAALISVLVLTSPALPAARRSLLRLKQLVSRPPPPTHLGALYAGRRADRDRHRLYAAAVLPGRR